MDWTADAFLTGLYREAEGQRKRNEEGPPHSEVLRRKRRESLQEGLGSFPGLGDPIPAVITETVDYGDFLMERVHYSTIEALHVPVLVLKPKGSEGPWPAVLACHGHGNGQWDAVGMSASGEWLPEPGIHNRFAVELVRRGLLVVIPEIIGFGVRRIAEEAAKNPKGNSCGTLASHLLMYGKTLAGLRVFEARRALDYICSRADTVKDKIGIFGFSGGGLVSAYTSALDPRIQAAVLTGFTNTFEGSILSMLHCIDNYVPGTLCHSELPDLIGLIAPRSLFVEAGAADPIFPEQYVRTAVAALEDTYKALGAAEKLGSDIFPGKHEISGRVSFDWLADRLKR